MKSQKDLIHESNRVLRGEAKAPTRKPVPPKTPAPVIEPVPEPAPVKRRGRPRKAT